MPSIQDIQKEIVETFNSLESWEQRYQYLIEKGRAMKSLPEEYQIEKNRIKGCQSQVWMIVDVIDKDGNKVINIQAYSDAAIVRGLIALLLQVYNNHSAKEILSAKLDFITQIGLLEHLSPNRKNGLGAMVKNIYALAQQSL